MDLGINGLRVLVTAGANGIGLAIARAFVREGAKVHVCDVDTAALAALKTSDPGITQSVCDVSDRAQVARLFDEALRVLGGLDCLVNNAGIAGPTGRVEEINPEDWDRCLAIDLTGQVTCARLAVPHLKTSKNASIMNGSSQAGKHGFPMRAPYAAAKWGVIGFTKSIALELAEHGVTANAVSPGFVWTPLVEKQIPDLARSEGISEDAAKKQVLSRQPTRQFVTVDQVAALTVFLASEEAASITGSNYSIDGGWTAQ